MALVRAWAAKQPGGRLEFYEYEPGLLDAEDVDGRPRGGFNALRLGADPQKWVGLSPSRRRA